MIFTASTVKDSPANVAAFVRRNLASGADHMFVFLDAPDAEVEALLADNPHVTCVVTDAAYWTPERPDSLNTRQVTNANLAMNVVAALPGDHWLFHIDADEVVQIDRDRFDQLGPEMQVAKLAPLEAISQYTWPGEVTHFKQMLSKEQINDLVERGIIAAPDPDEPHNGSYFRGHVQGKVGVRPNLDIRMQLHRAVFTTAEGDQVVKAFEAPWLTHLHYESHSGEEFVRKWMAHMGAGEVRFRPRRSRLRAEIEELTRGSAAESEAGLKRIYHEQIEDDFETLRALDLLVEPMPEAREPVLLNESDRRTLESVLALLVAADKRYVNPQDTRRQPVQLFRELAAQTADAGLGDALTHAVMAGERSMSERGFREPPRGGLLGRLRKR